MPFHGRKLTLTMKSVTNDMDFKKKYSEVVDGCRRVPTCLPAVGEP